MAKVSKVTAPKTATRKKDEWSIPDGFTINVGRERGDGWVKKEEGNEVMGRLLGRYTYENRGKRRAYYQVKLFKSCKAEVENPDYDEDDAEGMAEREIPERIVTTLGEGATVNVDETAKLQDLENHLKSGGVYDVWFVIGKKIDIGNGQTMWEVIGPRLRPVQKPDELPSY